MIDVAGSFREDHDIAGFVAVLLTHAREQIRELVVLLLRPLFERMIVAARAGQPLAEERLRGIFGDIDRILVNHEIIQRAVLPCVAG